MAEIFPIATRQPGVLGPSNQITVPAQAAGKKYQVLAAIAQVDLDDPTVAFSIEMQVRNPDLSWPTNANANCSFTGGPNQGKPPNLDTRPPGWEQDGDEIAGKDVRFRLTVTGRAVDLGLNATPLA